MSSFVNLTMELILSDTRPAVVRALRATVGHLQIPDARRVVIRIDDLPVSRWDDEGVCFVNGGNALGTMRGQLDRELSRLVPGAEADVEKVVQMYGETSRSGVKHLPLFSALLSPSSPRSRWLLTAPCMYVSESRELRGTRNAFHATHTALSLIQEANRAGARIRRVVMTGICTGKGRMNRDDAASQMADAFRAVFIDDNMVVDPKQAQHPRLMLNPQYTVQPTLKAHDPFQPHTAYVTANGTRELVPPPPIPVRTFRSGGSEEPSHFINSK